MDMLRFHKFTAGRFWVDDYGSADDPEEFKALSTLIRRTTTSGWRGVSEKRRW